MADTKITSATAATVAAGTMEIPINDSGSDEKLTVAQLQAYIQPLTNASTADQTGFASDVYLLNSNIAIPESRIKAGTIWRTKFDMTKTAAGVAALAMNVRYGTAGSTADTSRLLFTFPSIQTAAIDTAKVMLDVNFRVVGASAVIYGELTMWRTNTTTGFLSTSGLQFTSIKVLASSFSTSSAGNIMGLSINGGSAAAITIRGVQTELLNIL